MQPDAHDCKVPRFVGWDGEGVTDPDGTHRLILFGTADDYLTGDDLATVDCLDLILDADPSATQVIYAGDYDVNMILRDLTPEDRDTLLSEGHHVVYLDRYVLDYVPRKYFTVSGGSPHRRVTLWDVFTFYGTSFVEAVREYLPEHDRALLSEVEAMKGRRSEFVSVPLADVVRYWNAELALLAMLCNALGEYLERAGYLPKTWHGPGAVASAVYRKHASRTYMRTRPRRWDWPDEVAAHSYYGGRFEQFRVGRAGAPVYQYDLRSAYPAAISRLPDLHPSSGEWVHDECRYVGEPEGVPEVRGFGMYLVDYDGRDKGRQAAHPIPWRHPSGAVYWPDRALAWVHGPELEAALWADPGKLTVEASLEWVPGEGARELPMAFVGDLYATRAAWKRGGNPAQLALKLAMNSLYGKMVQQVGARRSSSGLWTLPRWHDLTWGGYVTSWCRGKLYEAMSMAGDDLVAVETDAVFSLRELPGLQLSDRLGAWDRTTYDDVAYLQSGVYFTRNGHPWSAKTRGFDRGSLTMNSVRRYLRRVSSPEDFRDVDPPTAQVTRFIAMTARRPALWRRWETSSRSVSVDLAGGKRWHDGDCGDCDRPLWDGMHALSCADVGDLSTATVSTPYPVAWRGSQ